MAAAALPALCSNARRGASAPPAITRRSSASSACLVIPHYRPHATKAPSGAFACTCQDLPEVSAGPRPALPRWMPPAAR
ncbi:hypothetical protein G6F64_014187 [Rhizopus arrhizus]|uniref:Uncharacterized protein n=1 Tax=Rhizopus oryzae TaxID=64495 RepID=A0A9P6WU17_RHIOR|nr:hypothetical protein G6F64_014187 [Rhizopus arrhizus]